ncbi:MAG: general secretion pathway protein GspF [Alteromonadaceae bacterium]|nr:general secretion pathway protein GspF [Alteromonadaceae bacterium]MBH86966.1 general secretion pathway protein GspF [Alteromonadaceae bacterium]|tara:strand:- start:4581 stop:6113 length:1533 start_codon:yes stop_codon:yes gene_type:complete
MFIKPSRKKALANHAPLKHGDHRRPITRREFISQGFMAGAATVCGTSLFSLLAPRTALAAISQDDKEACGILTASTGKVPFICFDLAGGANIAGSNVLVGKQGGQKDFLSTQGYSKQGLPGDMVPNNPAFIDEEMGLAFHADSAFLRGIRATTSAGTRTATNGTVFAARSENDTGNNPHNPMYGINWAGADGQLVSLIGSRSSESGGNSMAPMNLIDPKVRPTKIDRPSDATGLVDLGDLTKLLSQDDAVAVMESIAKISDDKMSKVSSVADINKLVNCGYIKSADLAARFGDPASLDPATDPDVVGAAGVFSAAEFMGEREFQKTASVMKLVIEGNAGAGTITMGGYDYHTGERGTGERRDYLAGRCMGACLEYAAKKKRPLMLYVFSDGSVSSNGRIDDSEAGRGKGEWTGDNQQTAASFALVYNPNGRLADVRNQIGYMRADGSVETASSPVANNVNQLVQAVMLNYMALHGEQGNFDQLFRDHNQTHGLGNTTTKDSVIAFPTPII